MPVEIAGKAKRFWSKVDKSGDCWEWLGGTCGSGYGCFWMGGKQYLAHRAAIILGGSDIPSGMVVCHDCDNKTCVNPDHLWIGTQGDNVRDMANKGRGPDRRGEKCPTSKLTKDQAISIKYDDRTHRLIAKDYGVNQTTVTRIKNGKRWSNI